MIAAEDVKAIHSCTGSVSDFAFSFKIFAEDDISVIATTADGDETTLTITTDYTVTGENGAFGSGGTVSTVKEVDGEMGDYNYPNGYKITILLNLELKQETDLVYGGKYSSSAIESMSDRLTKISQQMAEKQSRTLKLKRSSALDEPEIPDPTAGYYLYSPDGASITWVANVTTGETAVTDFGRSLIDDENASEAQTTLGLSAFIKTLTDDANAYTARKTLLTPMSRVLVAKTANYTVVAANDGALIPVDATADNIAITLPAVGDVWNGFTVGFKRIDSGANYVELTPDGSEKVDGASSHFIELENSVAWYTVDGTGWKIQTNNEITGAMCVAAMKDPAAGVYGLRRIGTTALKACAGNDARLSDERPPADGSIAAVKFVVPTAGDNIIGRNDPESTSISAAYEEVKKFTILQAGAFRIKFDLKRTAGGGNPVAYARIYRNTTAVGTEQSDNTGSYVTKSQDISGWSVGDSCILKLKIAAASTAYCKDYRLSVATVCIGVSIS